MSAILQFLSRLPTFVMLIVLCAAAASAIGQVLYKSTMPDGKVTYGDAPQPGAAKVETGQAQPSHGVEPVTPEQMKRFEAEQTQYISRLKPAHDEVSAAEAALKEAQSARDAGQETQPGERLGQIPQRAYFQRLKVLDDAVERAQERLDRARVALK